MTLPPDIENNLLFFRSLTTLKTRGQRRFAIRKATLSQISGLLLILLNFYLGKVTLPKNYAYLKRYRDCLSSILSKQTGLAVKQKELVQSADCVTNFVRAFLQYE